MDMIEVSAKTVNDAITEACQKLGVTSDKLDYEVVEEGSSGFLGIGAKPAVIKASVKKSSVEEVARVFLNDVFQAMNMEVVIDIKYNDEEKSMDIELSGNEMGVLKSMRIKERFINLCQWDFFIPCPCSITTYPHFQWFSFVPVAKFLTHGRIMY